MVRLPRGISDSECAPALPAQPRWPAARTRARLYGVPFTIKDAWEVARAPSTGGTLGRKNFLPARDATVVARLKAAGAIPLGMTNLPEFSMAFESNNLVHGQRRGSEPHWKHVTY